MVKLRNKIFQWLVLLPSVIGLLCACSAEHSNTLSDAPEEDNTPAEVTATDISAREQTRAANMDLNSFGLSVLNVRTGKLIKDKLLYVRDGSGFTPVDGSFRMITGEMKAISIAPSMNIVENITFTNDEQGFDYEVPTTNQTMVKISGNMSFTKQSTNNKLIMNFVNAISLFTVRARNELKVEIEDKEYEVEIFVKGITLHNLYSKGHFNYTDDNKGTWTPIDGYWANYTQDFSTAVKLSNTSFINVVDTAFALLPQSPQNNAWSPSGSANPSSEDAISVADGNHKMYFELRCAMTIQRNNQTVYVWGSPENFKPVYFPYIKNYCPKAWNTINRQSVYNLKIIKTEALGSDGAPIKPEEQVGENGQFENAVFIEVAPTDNSNNDNVDDWEDPNVIPLTI